MWPGAAVSGWYFSHPQSQYFVVGRLGRDQVAGLRRPQGLDPGRGRAVALAQPRLRPGGLMPARPALRPCSGTWTARWSTPSRYWIDDRVRDGREVRRHVDRGRRAGAGRQRPARLRAATSSERMGLDAHARGDRRGAARRRRRQGRARRCRGGPVPSSCSPRWARPGVRCGLVTMSYARFVAPILRPPAAGDLPGGGDRRRRSASGKPHPEPYLTAAAALGVGPRTAWRSRTPTPVPSPPRRPAAWCWWSRTTCRCSTGPRGCSATSLEGLTVDDLRGLSALGG